jgi:hypothetical protein
MTSTLNYDMNNMTNDISHKDFIKLFNQLDSLASIYDFINNSKLDIKRNEILLYITNEMIKKGAYNFRNK